MKFLVLCRQDAENQEKVEALVKEPHVWISIRDTSDKPFPNLVILPDLCRSTLYLKFDDYEKEEHAEWRRKEGKNPDAAIMNYDQAQRIYHCVNNRLKEIDLVCVHCAAGISRSPAVAKALSMWLNNNDGGFHHERGYFPNGHVYSLLSQVLREFQQK